jgi:ABC-type branched-subunit amino acid transport system substrate-binding protein
MGAIAFAIVVIVMVAAIAYATSLSGNIYSGPCAVSPPAATSSPAAIKIGFLTELTGPYNSGGYASRVAAELAVNQTNASGGIDGKQIQLVFADSQSIPSQATKCASVLDQQGVLAITGTAEITDALAVEAYAESHSVPFVLSAISSARMTPPGLAWTVSVQPDAVTWGAAVAKYVSQAVPGAKVALMTQNAEQQKEMSAGVRWYASSYKNESIVFDQTYANAQFPWATAGAAARFSGANAVIVSWLPTVGFSESNVIEALLSSGFNPDQIFVASATDQASDLGTQGSGIRGVTLFDGAMAAGYPNASSFVSMLQPVVNGTLKSSLYCPVCPRDIGPVYYYSYIGMRMIIESIESVLSSGQVLDRSSFESAIRHASVDDAFGNKLKIEPSGAAVGSYYAVAIGQLNETTNTYSLSVVRSLSFSAGEVPAYRVATGA